MAKDLSDKNYHLKSLTKTQSTTFKKGKHRLEKNWMQIKNAVDEAVTQVATEAMDRLSTNRKVSKEYGMWTVADEDSNFSIDAWRKERYNPNGNKTGFTLRNNAIAKNGYRYPDLIMNEPHISQDTADLTSKVWQEFWTDIETKLEDKVRKSIKDNSR